MKEAMLYEQLEGNNARCRVCLRRCLISPGRRGFCCTRENMDGRVYTLIYERVSSANVDPIEKKPLFHFYPGTLVYSLGSVGCTFRCPGCQNWQISRYRPVVEEGALRHLPAVQVVADAKRSGAAGICWTYNDPAIWVEYTLDGARLAKQHGLYTAYVTNGTATREHLDAMGPYLDGYRVDIKAFSKDAYRIITGGFSDVEQIFDSVEYAKNRWKMHVECVTNVTPTINDSEEELRGIARWMVAALGPDTPWHVTRFYPYQEFSHIPPTPMERLNRAYEIGHEEGLRYVYLGNVPGDPREDTHCPRCGHTVLGRRGFSVAGMHLRGNACPVCGTEIAGRWE